MDVPVEWDICVEMDVSADDGGMSLVSWLKAKRHDDWKITEFQKHVFISAEQVDNLTFEHVPWGHVSTSAFMPLELYHSFSEQKKNIDYLELEQIKT